MAGFISEWWPTSNRNGGRHQIGIPGRIESEFAPCSPARTRLPPLPGCRAPDAGDGSPSKAPQFLPLSACRPVNALAGIPLGLLHPSGNRLCGRLELARQLFGRASRSHQIDHLSPELRRISGSVTGHQTPQKSTSRVSTKPGQLQSPPRRSAPARSWRRPEPPDPGSSACRAGVRRPRLRDRRPSHWIRPIPLRDKVLAQARQPIFYTRPAGEECPHGKSCRRADRSGRRAQPSPCNRASSEGSDPVGRFEAHHQSPSSSPSSKARQKSGAFPPPALPGLDGRTPLSDSRPLHRQSRCRSRNLRTDGSPRLPGPPFQRAVPNYPGGPGQVRVSVASLSHAAFPESQAGRRPQLHFRGLRRLHSRYGPLDCSTAQGGLCRKVSIRPVTQPCRLPATRPTDNYLDGACLHW